MEKITGMRLTFTPSGSPDVVNYRLYYAPEGQLAFDSPFVDLGMSNDVDLSSFPDLLGLDGVYDVGIAAVDDVGNERMGVQASVPFDFIAPDAPTNISIIRL